MKKWTRLFCAVVSMGLSGGVLADNALQYFQNKAAAQQLPQADAALKNKDYQKALDIYKQLSESGHPVAEYQLAYLYLNGFGVEKNPSIAAAWFMKAGTLGLAQAQFALATLYYYGVGIEQGLTQAIT